MTSVIDPNVCAMVACCPENSILTCYILMELDLYGLRNLNFIHQWQFILILAVTGDLPMMILYVWKSWVRWTSTGNQDENEFNGCWEVLHVNRVKCSQNCQNIHTPDGSECHSLQVCRELNVNQGWISRESRLKWRLHMILRVTVLFRPIKIALSVELCDICFTLNQSGVC